MQEQCTLVTVAMYTLFLASTKLTLASEKGLSQVLQRDQRLQSNLPINEEGRTDAASIAMLDKKACNGFPCMYSHLGSKAGKASLYKALASFIDDCFNDVNCDPGRRKRQHTKKLIQTMIDTPLYKLQRQHQRKEKN